MDSDKIPIPTANKRGTKCDDTPDSGNDIVPILTANENGFKRNDTRDSGGKEQMKPKEQEETQGDRYNLPSSS